MAYFTVLMCGAGIAWSVSCLVYLIVERVNGDL